LRGRCFGCGATGHNKADCTESCNSTCRYCARRGHSDRVCQDRFMGLERNRGAQHPARVAATVSAPFSLFREDGMAPPVMPVAPAAALAQQVAAASHMIRVPPNVDPGLIELYNIDRTLNTAGSITHFARLRTHVDEWDDWIDYLVTDLEEEPVILGLPWLRQANLAIDWTSDQFTARRSRPPPIEVIPKEETPAREAPVDGGILEYMGPDP
ncbi:hypothetical protein GGG16DRAFT_21886, partial [Schizophyllum commune]